MIDNDLTNSLVGQSQFLTDLPECHALGSHLEDAIASLDVARVDWSFFVVLTAQATARLCAAVGQIETDGGFGTTT